MWKILLACAAGVRSKLEWIAALTGRYFPAGAEDEKRCSAQSGRI
jgi:hypothetical protein